MNIKISQNTKPTQTTVSSRRVELTLISFPMRLSIA